MEISVIIPTYKPKSYLWECLDFLRNQTLSTDSFEVLIVLNGCCEPYQSQIKEYLSEYKMSNVRFFQTNVPGVSNARNWALDNAKGDFITFIDDDDIISANYLLSLLEKSSDKALVVSDERVFVDSISQCSKGYISKAYQKFKTNDANSIFLKRSFLSSSCCKLIPKNIISDFRFNTSFRIGEDSLFMFSISKDIKEIRLADDAIYYRRCRSGSASRSEKTISYKMKICFTQIIEYIRLYLRFPFQYNFFLFLSRLAASALHIIK